MMSSNFAHIHGIFGDLSNVSDGYPTDLQEESGEASEDEHEEVGNRFRFGCFLWCILTSNKKTGSPASTSMRK